MGSLRVIVISKSKTGFTRRYGNWIADELNANQTDFKHLSKYRLQDYDVVIFGGGLYTCGINGLKKFKSYLPLLKGKRVIVYATGATPYSEEVENRVKQHNFTESELQQIEFYYLRGGFDYSRLGMIDKLVMFFLRIELFFKSRLKKNSDDNALLSTYVGYADFSHKKDVAPIVNEIKQLEQPIG